MLKPMLILCIEIGFIDIFFQKYHMRELIYFFKQKNGCALFHHGYFNEHINILHVIFFF